MYNILVCDDDKDIVEAIDIYLSKEGYNVIKAYDGMEAMEILKKEDIPISDVSTMVGYSDHSYFCRVFKKTTGYTPSVYRRRFR